MFGKTFLKKSLIPLLVALFLLALPFAILGVPRKAAVAPCDQCSLNALSPSVVEAAGLEPRCRNNACVANCLAYQNFLGADNFDAWCGLYTGYELTGCDDPALQQSAEFLLDVAAEVVGAASGTTMQCWEMVMGQASVCRGQCSSHDCKYAPNVHVTLDSGQPGYTAVTVDNRDHWGDLPERSPNAYSRNFITYFYLSRNGGQKLLVGTWDVPSLSYPNWITQGGLDTCMAQYGADDRRYQLLAPFDKPSEVPLDKTWGDGGIIDLTGLTKDAHGIDSQPSDGYIALMSDGDKITIKQGQLSGYVYVWEHNKSEGTYSETVTPWNAYGSDQTFTNHERNEWYHLFSFWADRVDRDTYVFATTGPSDCLIRGDYTVQVEARLSHDKDINDNTVAYSYTLTEPPPPPPPPDGGEEEPQIQDIGSGTYYGVLSLNNPYDLYRIQVPAGLAELRVDLGGIPDEDQFALYLQKGQIPTGSTYDCRSWAAQGYIAICEEFNPVAGDYYVKVERLVGAGEYTLHVNFITTPPPPPPPPTPPPPPPPPPPSQVESEPNNEFNTANQWNVSEDMGGKLSVRGDHDYFQFVVSQPGIYTVHLSDVPANIKPRLEAYSARRIMVASDYPTTAGQSASVSFDANAGETYYVEVRAYESQVSDQFYILSVTTIPDPNESDDTFDEATTWDFTAGPAHGYFWERVSGPSDYYVFTVPSSLGSVLLTMHLTDVPANIKPRLEISSARRITVASDYPTTAGQSAVVTFDANAGETYYVTVRGSDSSQVSNQLYTLSVTTIADPNEPDDTFDEATTWDFTTGPAHGYFWERVSGPCDHYVFTVPGSLGSVLLTVHLNNVPANIKPRLEVYSARRITIASDYATTAGQSASVTLNANAGETYYVTVRSSDTSQVSDQLYTLSVTTS